MTQEEEPISSHPLSTENNDNNDIRNETANSTTSSNHDEPIDQVPHLTITKSRSSDSKRVVRSRQSSPNTIPLPSNTPTHFDGDPSSSDAEDLELLSRQGNSIIVGGGSFVVNRENVGGNSTTTTSDSTHEVLYNHFRTFLMNNTCLYWVYYVTMIALCTSLLIWSFVTSGKPHSNNVFEVFISLEGIITFILIFEIFIRIFIFYNGNIVTYLFDDFINWFDLIVSVFCVIGFILYLVTYNKVEERIEEMIDSLLITFRYITQVLRIIILIRNQRKRRQQLIDQQSQYIDLSSNKMDRNPDQVPLVHYDGDDEQDEDEEDELTPSNPTNNGPVNV